MRAVSYCGVWIVYNIALLWHRVTGAMDQEGTRAAFRVAFCATSGVADNAEAAWDAFDHGPHATIRAARILMEKAWGPPPLKVLQFRR